MDHEAGAAGTLVAHGDQGGGYAIYVGGPLAAGPDHVVAVHNDGHGAVQVIDVGALAPGARSVTLDLHAGGGGVWTPTLSVDGVEVGAGEPWKILFPMQPFEGITVGRDPRSPVSWRVYEQHGSFAYSGAGLRHVRYDPGEPAPDSPFRFQEQMREIALQYG